jgi:hypothetical protein
MGRGGDERCSDGLARINACAATAASAVVAVGDVTAPLVRAASGHVAGTLSSR